MAQSIKQIQKTTVSFQTDTIARGVARAEEQILLLEAEVQASSHFSKPVTQDAPYTNLIDHEELTKEIEKLKNEKELLN